MRNSLRVNDAVFKCSEILVAHIKTLYTAVQFHDLFMIENYILKVISHLFYNSSVKNIKIRFLLIVLTVI